MRYLYMLWERVGLGGWRARGGTRHTRHKPISIIINHKFITPPAISTLGDFSLSQNGQPILAQPNFHTLQQKWPMLTQVEMIFWFVSTIHTYENFPKFVYIFYLAYYSKVSTLFETLAIAITITLTLWLWKCVNFVFNVCSLKHHLIDTSDFHTECT